ncbi:MAG TPA: DOMON-like domain-containing protein [Burkholderiales bacterium]|nr:DOMON-like domain-containing protein [Burkholderiales bacterium]
MPADAAHTVRLTCHSDTPGGALRSVGARVRAVSGGALAVTYVFEGDLDRLRVPAPRIPRIANRLWQHTCCEIFIARKGLPEYHEFNLSPSGEWAAYAFRRYRDAAPLADESTARELDPRIAVRRAAGKLELDAMISLDRLSPVLQGLQLSLALSAVVESQDGLLSYWALRHPPGKPDFHHADAFALELDQAQAAAQSSSPSPSR